MKKTPVKYIFYALLLFCISCSSQSECEKFKTGKYKINDLELKHESVIERTEFHQIERSITTGTESKYEVSWLNDCEYTLKLLSGSEDLTKVFKDKLLRVKVIPINEDQYELEASFEGGPIGRQKMVRVK